MLLEQIYGALLVYGNIKSKDKGLTIDDIIIPDICPIFGVPLQRENKKTWQNAPSIDRIDNTKGYVQGNIVIISRRANILKKDATIEELIKLSKFYEHFLSLA